MTIFQEQLPVEEASEEEEEPTVWYQAKNKYEVFQRIHQELLDPNLETEFAEMRKMGLPTMLINSYEDADEVNVT